MSFGWGDVITYPNIIVTLNELRVTKQTSFQDGLQERQVDHVEKQQAQNGQVDDDSDLRWGEEIVQVKRVAKGQQISIYVPIAHFGYFPQELISKSNSVKMWTLL